MNKLAKALTALLLGFATLLPAQATSAHAELETSNPEANSVIGAAPAVVSLTFGEKLMVVGAEKNANQAQVTNAAGTRVDNADFQVTGEVLTVSLKPDLADDTYKVTYRVVSEDGHPIEGAYTFDVNAMARSGEATPMAVDDGAPTATLYDDKIAQNTAGGDNGAGIGAGIGVGVGIGALILGAAMFFLFRKIRNAKK